MKESKPSGYWNKLENVLAEAKRVKEENNLDRLPGATKLREMGHGGLVGGISKYNSWPKVESY